MSAPDPGRLLDPPADAGRPALVTPDGRLSAAALRARIAGAADGLAPGLDCAVQPGDARVWLPWLAGCLVAGGLFRFGANGHDVAPPERAGTPTPVPADTPCLKVRTSGSTGAAKTLVRDAAGWLACFDAEARALDLEPGDRLLTLGAPDFSLTPYVALGARARGQAVGVLGQVREAAARAVMDALRPTVLYGVPPLLFLLARVQLGRGADPAVRRVVAGGARLTPVQAATLRRAWPNGRLVTFYGAAETSFVTLNTAPDPHDPADVGPPFTGVDARADDDGTLSVQSPYCARFLEDPDGRRRPLAGADGAVRLNDRVSVDARGHLWLAGRADDRINLGGGLVDPGPGERALERLPWVAEAALLPVPDPLRSTQAAAVLVAADAVPADAEAQVRAVLAETPAGLRARQVYAVSAEVPRSAGGKLDRRRLAAAIEAGRPAGQRVA